MNRCLEARSALSATTHKPIALTILRVELDGGRAADDDSTFLLLHRSAGNPGRLSVRQKLDVYAKVFHLKGV